jgi:hypothetical protein
MHDRFRIPDPETRAKSNLFQRGYANANLKAASRLLELSNLDLDDAIALVEKDLRLPLGAAPPTQRRARLLYGKNSMPTQKIES